MNPSWVLWSPINKAVTSTIRSYTATMPTAMVFCDHSGWLSLKGGFLSCRGIGGGLPFGLFWFIRKSAIDSFPYSGQSVRRLSFSFNRFLSRLADYINNEQTVLDHHCAPENSLGIYLGHAANFALLAKSLAIARCHSGNMNDEFHCGASARTLGTFYVPDGAIPFPGGMDNCHEFLSDNCRGMWPHVYENIK